LVSNSRLLILHLLVARIGPWKQTRPTAIRRGPIAVERIPEMTFVPTTPPADETRVSSAASVTVRYWAAARAAAGVREDHVRVETVAAALDAVRAMHDEEPRFAQVLSVCSFLLGDRPLGSSDLAEVAVRDGDVLEVLPPFAGG